jgi:hypothetical protein
MLASDGVADEIVAVCGRVVGGLLTRDDFDAVLPALIPTREVLLAGAGGRAAFVPWREAALRGREEETLPAASVHAVLAIDHRGLVALACYERTADGVAIEALDLVAPLAASPVLRGQTRVRPGTPIPAAAPLALVRTESEAAIDMALAVARDAAGERVLADALDRWSKDADIAPTYEDKSGDGTLLGAVRRKNAVSVLARRSGA